MNRKKTLIALGLLIIVCVVWLLFPRHPVKENTPQTKDEPTPEATSAYITTRAPRQEPGGPYAPADPRWPERTRRLKADPQYEWKTPIEFYGKVIDQDRKPVTDATVDVIWTDMSAKGSSHMETTSDAAGLFSIAGIRGKHMTVQVNKEGYYRQLTDAKSAFEYAGFWEPSYHVPDKGNPVIFRLRKKGEAAPLVATDGKIVLEFDKATTISMPREINSTSTMNLTVFENTASPRKWRARFSVEGGGITPTLEEFPFEAPEQGYRTSLDLDEGSAHPPGWQDLFQGGRFYFKIDKGYGLLEIEQIVGKKTLHYRVKMNANGGRSLEDKYEKLSK